MTRLMACALAIGGMLSAAIALGELNGAYAAQAESAAAAAAGAYFPPPRSKGDWRSLVRRGTTPGSSAKSRIRSLGRVDWDRLKRAYDYSRSYDRGSSLLVIRNGYIVGEWGSASAQRVNSVSKSLTGLAMAKLFDMSGRISVDSYAHNFLPDSWERDQAAKRKIKIRHLMTMTSGLRPHDQPGSGGYTNTILRVPVADPPGRVWAYASAPVDLLSVVVSNVAGRKLRDLFNNQIAGPIGAGGIRWDGFDKYTGASSKAYISPRSLARVGYLMMMNGKWNGRTVVSAGQIDKLVRGCDCSNGFDRAAGSSFDVGSNSADHYGMLFWNNRGGKGLGGAVPNDAFYMHGLRENLVVVVPSRKLIVVRLGDSPVSRREFKNQLMSRVMGALVSG